MSTWTDLRVRPWNAPEFWGIQTASEASTHWGRLMTCFRCFLSAKLLLSFLLACRWNTSLAFVATLLLAVAGSITLGLPRLAVAGACAWSLLSAQRLSDSWPVHLNHTVLELLILLCLAATSVSASNEQRSRRLATSLWAVLLSVWFYAGLQKIVHGRYLSGETLAVSLLWERSTLGDNLRLGLGWLYALVQSPQSVKLPLFIAEGTLPLGNVERNFCIGLSWTVVTTEIALPLWGAASTFWPRYGHWYTGRQSPGRSVLVAALCACQLGIGVVSGELDFAWTAVGLMLLGSPRSAPRWIAALTALMFTHALFGLLE